MLLKECCSLVSEKIDAKLLNVETYISTENLVSNFGGFVCATNLPKGKVTRICNGDILISNIRPYFKKGLYCNFNGGCSNDVFCIRNKSDNYLNKYIYYCLTSNSFIDKLVSSSKGTKMPRGDKNVLLNYVIPNISKQEQQHIVNILGTIDEKIENNEKIIKLLKQLFTLKCNDFFDNLTEYNCKNLDEIAIFTNGLPMQKFRPQGNNFLPVLKIKELNQGTCDTNSEHCDTQIPDIYIVNNGDVIFSWSGTLLVDLWKGEKCGLNQHLYKVTSSNYPKWFYYYWINKYLPKFINIAQGKATTMGHIKRSDITNSIVKIPNSLNDISFVSKYIEKIIKINKINNKLKKLKNIYLAKFFQ